MVILADSCIPAIPIMAVPPVAGSPETEVRIHHV